MNNALSSYNTSPTNNGFEGGRGLGLATAAAGQEHQPVPITQLRRKIDIVRASRADAAGLRPATGSQLRQAYQQIMDASMSEPPNALQA